MEINRAKLSPMMQKYFETKDQYPGCILFYRLGDFYEMFFDDAITASKALEITLTGKECGLEERAPMCGVPFHAVDTYLNKLVSRGYKVAICEQVEDPKQAKGLVKRAVVRIATPGTNLNTQSLDETKNNYLMCIVYTTNAYGVSYVDVTTGEYYVTEFDSENKLLDEIFKTAPSEIICNDSFLVSGIDLEELHIRLNVVVSAVDNWHFDESKCEQALMEHFGVSSLDGLGLADYSIGITAAGAVMQYLTETQKTSMDHITSIKPYITNHYMLLDRSTRRNLELCETMREKSKRGSLFWILDKTKTAMGARLLRNSIEQPLIDIDEINTRLDIISEFNDNAISREELREYLSPIYDIERLISKISYKSANPRDLIAFRQSLSMLPHIKYVLSSFSQSKLKEYGENLDDLFQIGCIGMIKAIDNFDISLNVQFSTYAVPMIIGEIRRHLRDNNPIRVSRSMRDLAYRALQTKERLFKEKQQEPTIEDIAKELGVDKEDVVVSLDSIQDPISLQEPVYNEGSESIYVMDQVKDSKNTDEFWAETLTIAEAMKKLSNREKSIISRRFFDGRTQMEVANEIGISQAQVSRLEKNAIERIKKMYK